LKQAQARSYPDPAPSRPAGARGLKPTTAGVSSYFGTSRPAGARGLKLPCALLLFPLRRVAPRRGAWIETVQLQTCSSRRGVAPRRGAWIETTEERAWYRIYGVAPRRGAWIETLLSGPSMRSSSVAPRRGAWIETPRQVRRDRCHRRSRPAGARGLKLIFVLMPVSTLSVAPRRGAWIETSAASLFSSSSACRAPQGRVD